MQILQFPDSSWGLTVLKNIFLRFIGLKGLKMVWKKVPWFEFFPDFGWKTPVFPWFPWLEKVFKIFPEFPDFPDRWEPCLNRCYLYFLEIYTYPKLTSFFLLYS